MHAEDNFEKATNEAQETWSDRLVSELNATIMQRIFGTPSKR